MTLTIQTVPARRGMRWMQDGLRQFARHPMAFGFMFAVTAAAAMVLSFIPTLGTLIVLCSNPIVCLGFMVATDSALKGGPIHPGQFVTPLMTDAPRRRSLLMLCLLSGLANVALLWISQLIGAGADDRLAAAMPSQGSVAEIQRLAQDPRLQAAVLFRSIGMLLVALAFWHAPAFVHWGRQGWAQSLFSSVLCVWRNRGAVLVFGLTWLLVFLALSTVCRLALAMAGLASLGLPFIFGLALVFVTAGMVSLLFSFRDSVRDTSGEVPVVTA